LTRGAAAEILEPRVQTAAQEQHVTNDTILAAHGLHRWYGGVHALRGAEFSIRPAEVHALVGENGSGKSTLLRILSGQLRPDEGTVELDGKEVSFGSPMAALRAGIVTVTQETTLAPDLSVAENIFLGHRMVRGPAGIDWRSTQRRARALLERLGLDHVSPRTLVRRLRPDQQQMVEIARAISMEARVLILDEPTSSLTDDEVEALFATVRRLKEAGVATIFVSHRLNEIFQISESVTVLRDGVTVGAGPTADHDRSSLIHLMVGKAHEELEAAPAPHAIAEPVLGVKDFEVEGAVQGVNLSVARGEIVGLAGLVGAGRSELLEGLFGLHAHAGEVTLAGERVRFTNPRQAVAAGVAFIPADRKRHGLVLSMTVRENLMMVATSHLLRISYPSAGRELPVVRRAMQNLRVRAASHRVGASTLSGGNQQKVVLAKWLATEPKVLMADEPTRGVDVGAKVELYRLLREAAESGIGVLVSSSETPELLTLCDRILVLFRGRIVAELSRAEASEASIAHYATGHR
jgi:ABC-type sugar transport system ATPase subunit